jgi:3-hydroxymyristoyl/3-hydroxydecanoyl-(acyl carrier protein) dehydratase
MLDRLVHCEGMVAGGELLIREGNVFSRGASFTESGMLEALAQTAAARTSLVQRSQAGAENRPPQVGVKGSIKDFRLHFQPKTGETIETEIELLHEFLNASVIRGRVLVAGAEACSAELKIFLTEDHQAS